MEALCPCFILLQLCHLFLIVLSMIVSKRIHHPRLRLTGDESFQCTYSDILLLDHIAMVIFRIVDPRVDHVGVRATITLETDLSLADGVA
jgi:hypothetical protein